MTAITKTSTGSAYGVSVDLAAATVVNGLTTGAWITGLNEIVITDMAIIYTQTGSGTVTGAVLTGIDVMIGGDVVSVYEMVDDAQAAIAYTFGADTKRLLPLQGVDGMHLGGKGCIDAIRARVTVTAAAPGSDTEVLKLTFLGREAVWMT